MCSEGNWHNALIGCAYWQRFAETREACWAQSGRELAHAIVQLNGHECSRDDHQPALLLRSRTHNTPPLWDFSRITVERKAAYYQACADNKLAAQAAGVLLWSFVVQNEPAEHRDKFDRLCTGLRAFWHQETTRWCSRLPLSTDQHFRAVDQALAIIALVRMNCVNTASFDTYARIVQTRKTLATTFLVCSPWKTICAYVGKDDNHLAWQHLWICFAMLCSATSPVELNEALDLLKYVRTQFAASVPSLVASSPTGTSQKLFTNDNAILWACFKLAVYLE